MFAITTTTTVMTNAVQSLSGIPGWVAVVTIGAVILLSGVGVLIGRLRMGRLTPLFSFRRKPQQATGLTNSGVGDQNSGKSMGPNGSNGNDVGQSSNQPSNSGDSIIRSWIAIALVSGLLILCAVAFTVGDQTTRSTLIGGLVTSTGAAVAFYFSAQSQSDQRQDLLTATQGTSTVPTLKGLKTDDAKAAMAITSLQLVLDFPTDDYILNQSPNPGTNARNGTAVVVVTGPTPPTK